MTERTLPTGTLTFLASDMVGSTRLVQEVGPGTFREIIERHNEVLRAAFAAHGGTERGTQGDSFLVMFSEAPAALAAAADAQTAMAATEWPSGADVQVRMGLHTGVGALGGDDYVGVDVHRAARIASAAHGGQVLVSETTRALATSALPANLTLRTLGEHKLRDIARPEVIYQLEIDGLRSDFPAIDTEVAAPGNLPARLTSFVGRDRDLDELDRLLERSRLLTLTGPAGTGKTSLAVELARRHAGSFRHGAWFVALDAITDPALVVPAVASALSLLEAPGRSTSGQLAGYLADRSLLLILDNFEQVVPAATLLGDLLHAAADVKIVVTSRVPLRITAEQEYPLAPLGLPTATDGSAAALDTPAIQLFVDRARRARPGFELAADDTAAVAEICRRLDGLPLAIELAASRVALLPPKAMAARLIEHLDLPGAGARDLPDRQRSMERAIDWSHELLEPAARRLLARLSVFRGGCRLDEAEAVCGPPADLGVDVLEGLSILVDHSLVQPIAGPDGARFHLLQTIQAYATERLVDRDEAAQIQRRHALAFRDLAEAAALHLETSTQRAWLDRLAAEHDNLRAAVRWAIEHGDPGTAQRLGAALWRFWQIRGHLEEGRSVMARILAMPGADEPTTWRMRALEAEAGLRYWSADMPGADDLYEQQLDLARHLGDPKGVADALFNLTHTRFLRDRDHAVADQFVAESNRLYREIGDERSVARVEWTRLNRLLEQGAPDVEQKMVAALHRFELLEDDRYVVLMQGTLGWAALGRGDFAEACRWSMLTLAGNQTMGDVASITVVLRGLAVLFRDWGMPTEAATVQSAFTTLSKRYGIRPPAYFEELSLAERGRVEIDLEPYPDAVARGAAMSADEAVDYVVGLARERLGLIG